MALWVVGSILGVAFALAPSRLSVSAGALVAMGAGMLVLRGLERAALGGGAATVLGILFLAFTAQAIERCAQFNRQPGGRCEMGDSTPFVLVALIFLACGATLSALGFARRS
jgi:hypothetical protein